MMENVNNFLTEIIDEDIANGLSERIHTRFPPEPNGYLHIGSAKAIFINWSIAKKYNGLFNLRYDDTNPVKEDTEYVDSIWEDIKWLTGEEPSGGVYYGSDYFETCFECAVQLIKEGKAYVDDLTQEEMRAYRGSLTEPGKPSPYRDRSVEENLQLFQDMRDGKFADGSKTLRAKIDMASPNMNLRDPAIYRIVRAHHHRQGDKWCIYPMYDFAHPIQDALEGITHSMCSIEFENHRPLYEWVVDNCPLPHHPKQREFARLNVTHTVMSKRYLRQLVFEKHVEGWDDPRMPTLCALRRRGYTPSAILDFVQRAGIAKANSLVDIKLLEHCIREELNDTALRRMAVTEPVKLVITNYPEGQCEEFEVPNNPRNECRQERVQFREVVLHDLRQVVLVHAFQLGLLVIGDDQRLELSVFGFQYERLQHEIHVVELVLDLLRVDVLSAAGEDHRLRTAPDVERAVGVHRGHVARMQPPVGFEDLFGVLFVLVISLHHMFAADDDFARFVLRVGRVDLHFELFVQVAPARSGLELVVGREADERRALGQIGRASCRERV